MQLTPPLVRLLLGYVSLGLVPLGLVAPGLPKLARLLVAALLLGRRRSSHS